jgi:hypothetical protein
MPVRIGKVIEFTGIDHGEFSKVLKSLGAG